MRLQAQGHLGRAPGGGHKGRGLGPPERGRGGGDAPLDPFSRAASSIAESRSSLEASRSSVVRPSAHRRRASMPSEWITSTRRGPRDGPPSGIGAVSCGRAGAAGRTLSRPTGPRFNPAPCYSRLMVSLAKLFSN